MTKPTFYGAEMDSGLTSVGFYSSPLGGAAAPYLLRAGEMLFELIMAGSVYSPAQQLCHAGWIFCHGAGDHTVWQSEATSHYECLAVRFNLGMHRVENWPRAFLWHDTQACIAFAHEILHAFHHAEVSRDILGDLIWSQLRFKLDQYRRGQATQAAPVAVSRAINYVEGHFAQNTALTELAKAAGVSASSLHAQFKKHMGMSPHQYVITCRMREARQLLVTTNDPIKAVSEAVGYANAENFCRVFKRHAKITAAAYRRKYTRLDPKPA